MSIEDALKRGGTVGFAVNDAELGELLGFFECGRKEVNKRVKAFVFGAAREVSGKQKEAVGSVGVEGQPASAATD